MADNKAKAEAAKAVGNAALSKSDFDGAIAACACCACFTSSAALRAHSLFSL